MVIIIVIIIAPIISNVIKDKKLLSYYKYRYILPILSTKEIKHEKSDNLLIINPYENSSKPRYDISQQ